MALLAPAGGEPAGEDAAPAAAPADVARASGGIVGALK